MKNRVTIISFIFTFFFILGIFFLLLISDRKPNVIPSVLLNKNVPIFTTETLFSSKKFDSSKEFGKETIIVNFFATWCRPCLKEHYYLKQLSDNKKIKILGINYKDDPLKAINWLKELGNPYANVLIDRNASIGIDWGVYGIPETFIVNAEGIIKYKLIGPITKGNYEDFYLKITEIEK